MVKNSIHWFRKGLRLHDNPALLEAVRDADTLHCVYFLDPWFAGSSSLGVNRWRFLLQCLEDLDASLRKINSRLFVIRGQPANIFPGLFKEWKITQLTFECDSEPFGKERDAAIQKLASEAGVEVLTRTSHTLYDLDKIIELNGGHAPLTYKRFQTLVGSMPPPDPPMEALTLAHLGRCVTPVSKGHREKYGVPLLEELGFDTEGLAPAVWPGGEMEALARIEAQLLAPELSAQVNVEGDRSSSSSSQQTSNPQQTSSSSSQQTSNPQQTSSSSSQQTSSSSSQQTSSSNPQQTSSSSSQQTSNPQQTSSSSSPQTSSSSSQQTSSSNPQQTSSFNPQQTSSSSSQQTSSSSSQQTSNPQQTSSSNPQQTSSSNPQQTSSSLSQQTSSSSSQQTSSSSSQQTSSSLSQQTSSSLSQQTSPLAPLQSPLLCSSLDLSPYLRFGCLSCRLYYSKLAELNSKVKSKLLWREFFYAAATNNPRFDKMDGNPVCIRIPWDRNPQALAKWAEAKTGFPWIDAIMTQLRLEGWIHPLARHAVACFLTRGDLWVSWEEGMKVFDELLLDADWSVNAGSWMCHSCSSFFQQFFHCYCPVDFGRRMDASGDYIRRYLPVFKDFPTKYIYDPWNAPDGVQRAARCVVGVDYPRPMVNHAESSRLNIERMRQIYQQLSRYRSLSLLADVPAAPTEDLNVNGNRGAMLPPAGKKHRGTNGHHGHRERREQVGPSGLKPGPTDQQSCRTSQAEQGRVTNQESRSDHEFVVPQHPGHRGHGARGVFGKRKWEPEQDGGGDNDMASCAFKVQRQNKQKSSVGQEEGVVVSS